MPASPDSVAAAAAGTELLDLAALGAALAAAGPPPVRAFREALRAADTRLRERFRQGVHARVLVPLRARLVDRLLALLWRHFIGEARTDLALLAVGGYGRG